MSQELSFEQKLVQLNLTCDYLCYKIHLKKEVPFGDTKQMVLGWQIAERFYSNRIYRVLEGRCSLQESLDFDMEKEEKDTEDLVTIYTSILEQFNPKKVISILNFIRTI